MTKAERIFHETRYECTEDYRRNGYRLNADGTVITFNGLIYGEDEFLCKRTLNAVGKLIENMRQGIQFDKKCGFITEEEYTERMHIYNMVLSCFEKSISAQA